MDINVLRSLQSVDGCRALDINSKACDEYFSKVLDGMSEGDCITNHKTEFLPSGSVMLFYCLNDNQHVIFFDEKPEESYVDQYLDKFESDNDDSGFYIFLVVLLGIAIGCIMFICL